MIFCWHVRTVLGAEFERGRGVCRRNSAGPRNQPKALQKFRGPALVRSYFCSSPAGTPAEDIRDQVSCLPRAAPGTLTFDATPAVWDDDRDFPVIVFLMRKRGFSPDEIRTETSAVAIRSRRSTSHRTRHWRIPAEFPADEIR